MQKPAPSAVSLLAALVGFLAPLALSAQTTITLVDSPLYYTDAHTTTVADPLTFTITDGLATQSGPIDGDGSVTKTGAGSLVLAGANTYTGGTVVDAGVLAVDRDGATTFGTLGSGATTIHGDSASGLAGTLQFLTNSSAGGGAFTVTGGATSGGYGGTVEFHNTASAGSGTFTADGATAGGVGGGFVFFLGTSTAGSATLIANGSATAGAGGFIYFGEDSLGGTAAVKVDGNGLLDIGYHNAGVTIGSLEGTGQVFLGANALTIGSNNADTTFSGIVQDGGAAGGVLGSLTKTGSGTLTLSGANTYTGGTTITAGQITMGDAGALGTGSVSVAGGATLDASSYGFDLGRISGTGTLTSSGIYTASPGSDVTLATSLAGTASLTKTGTATLTLTGTNTYTGVTTISAGTLQIGDGGTTGSIVGDVVDNASLTFNRSDATTYAGVISGSGSVAHTGTSTLTLTGTNTYSGGTTVSSGGLLEFTTDANLGTGNITLDYGGLKWATGNTTDVSARLNSIGSGGTSLYYWFSQGTFNTNGNDVVFNTPVTGVSGAMLQKTGAGTLTLKGGTTSPLDYYVTGGTLTFATGTYDGVSIVVGDGSASDPLLNALASAAVITGAGTSVSMTNGFYVGNYNALSAALTISGGASVTDLSYESQIGVGSTAGAESTLTVTGAGSTYTAVGVLTIGIANHGQAALVIADGGSVTTQETLLGTSSQALNIGTVSGAGSLFTTNGKLTIGGGYSRGSSLTISDGASASAITTLIGENTYYGGANSLTLTGTGSTFTNTGSLTLAVSALDKGTLNLGSAAADAATAAGILDTDTVTGGLGTAVLQFNTTGTDLAPTYFTRDGTRTGTGVNTSGSLSLVNTAGTTVLSGTGTQTGATIINGGTLVATQLANGGASSSIGQSSNSATNLVLNGGALRYTGGAQSTDRLFQVGATTAGATGTLDASGTGALAFTNTGSLAYGTANQTRTLALTGTNTGANTLAALIADNGTGAVSLAKSGAGTWALTGTNTYTGGTTISAGTLQLGDGGTTGSVTGNMANDAALVFDRSDATTYAGIISGSGSVTQAGTGTLTLTGANTYTGVTTLSGGALQIGNGGTTGSIVGDVVNNTALTFNRSNATTYAGVISGSGVVAQAGTGTLTLTGTNTYAGGTSVTNYGTLEFSSGDNLGTGNLTLDGGILKWAAGNTADISSRLNSLNYNGAIFDTNGNHVSFASTLSGEDGSWLAKSGTGTLTLSGFTGTNLTFGVTGGTLNFGTGAYQGNLDIGGTALSANPQSDRATAVIISGTGTSFVSDGSTSVGNANGLSASLTISGGASFSDGSSTQVGSNSTGESTLTVTGSGSTFTGSGIVIGQSSSGRSTFSVSDGASVTAQYTNLGASSTGESLLTVSGTGSTFTSTGGLTIGVGPGSGQLSTDSSSVIVSDGASASAGTTVIGEYGSLGANSLTIAGAGSKFTTGTLTLAVGASDNGTLNLGSAAGARSTAAGILDTATVTGGLGAATLQFNTTGTALAPTYFTRDGTSTGTGVNTAGGLSLVNTAGTTVLTGTLAHTGATTINGGRLVVDGSITNSAVTVNTGGTLGGSGTVGALTLASGSTLSPGNSPGTLHAGDTTIAGGANLQFEVNNATGAPGTNYDLLAISGALALTATSVNPFIIDLTSLKLLGNTAGLADNFDSAASYSFTFLTTTGGITGFSADEFLVTTTNFQNPFNGTWSVLLTNSGYDLTLSYGGGSAISVVPEPSTYAAIFGAAALGCAVWSRRRVKHPRACQS